MTAAKNAGQLLFTDISVVVGDMDAKGSENPCQMCAHRGKKPLKWVPLQSTSTLSILKQCTMHFICQVS